MWNLRKQMNKTKKRLMERETKVVVTRRGGGEGMSEKGKE